MKPPGSGRKRGTPNKATADIARLARKYTAKAIETLSELMEHGKTEQTRLAAANSLMDRGHGKPSQTIAGDSKAPLPIRIIDPTRPQERPHSNGNGQVAHIAGTVASVALRAAQDEQDAIASGLEADE